MKLPIGEKINHFRRLKNMTQEQLANQIGISAQAISGWERGIGYPDITLLPSISHTLEISIDELMGNDEFGVNEDISYFFKTIWTLDRVAKVDFALQYYRKYPKKAEIADMLVSALSDIGTSITSDQYSILKEVCNRIIENCNDNTIRRNAVRTMSLYADDIEAERWLDMNPNGYYDIQGEIYERRLKELGRINDASHQRCINFTNMMLYIISKEPFYDVDKKEFIGYYAYLRKLIQTFGEHGEIPDGWLCKYAFISLLNAAGLFSVNKDKEGFNLLDEAVRAYKQYFALPDDVPLSMGLPELFGNITVKKYTFSGHSDIFSSGVEASYCMQNPAYLYSTLTDETDDIIWKSFDCVRDDPRFKTIVEEAKAIYDEWLKKRGTK